MIPSTATGRNVSEPAVSPQTANDPPSPCCTANTDGTLMASMTTSDIALRESNQPNGRSGRRAMSTAPTTP